MHTLTFTSKSFQSYFQLHCSIKLNEPPCRRYTRRLVGEHDLSETLAFTYTDSTRYDKCRNPINDTHFCFETTTHIAKTDGTA